MAVDNTINPKGNVGSKRRAGNAPAKSAPRKKRTGNGSNGGDGAGPDDQVKAPNVSPAQYIRNIKAEISKITWPSKKETMMGTAMVLVMVTIVSIFLFFVDQFFAWLVATYI